MIKMLHFLSHFPLLKLRINDEKRRWWLEDHDEKWAMLYVCTYMSSAFVFRLQCVLLSLSLSLFFVFKKLRVHKRIICAIDVRIPPCSSSSLPDMFYNHTNTTVHVDVHIERRRTGEKERTKDAKKLSMNVYNEDEEKNVAPNVVFLSCYRIRENEDVKKDVFFFFFALSIRAHHPSSNIHS